MVRIKRVINYDGFVTISERVVQVVQTAGWTVKVAAELRQRGFDVYTYGDQVMYVHGVKPIYRHDEQGLVTFALVVEADSECELVAYVKGGEIEKDLP